MTSADLSIVKPEVCPYLGLPDDPRTRFTFADPAHRCHAKAKPSLIDLAHQGAYCLTSGYPACQRFPLPRAAGRPASPVAAASAGAPLSRDGGTNRSRGRGGRSALRRVAAPLSILALVIAVGALGGGAIGAFTAGGGVHSEVPSPSTAATPAPTPASAGTPTPAPAPTQPPSSSTPAPTRNPAAKPIIHVVVRGETLTSIAAHYRVTAKAIQDANKIVDPSLIRAGDRLVIPPPP